MTPALPSRPGNFSSVMMLALAAVACLVFSGCTTWRHPMAPRSRSNYLAPSPVPTEPGVQVRRSIRLTEWGPYHACVIATPLITYHRSSPEAIIPKEARDLLAQQVLSATRDGAQRAGLLLDIQPGPHVLAIRPSVTILPAAAFSPDRLPPDGLTQPWDPIPISFEIECRDSMRRRPMYALIDARREIRKGMPEIALAPTPVALSAWNDLVAYRLGVDGVSAPPTRR